MWHFLIEVVKTQTLTIYYAITCTLAPFCSRSSQIPRPIPDAPPVTNAMQPEIFIVHLLLNDTTRKAACLRLDPSIQPRLRDCVTTFNMINQPPSWKRSRLDPGDEVARRPFPTRLASLQISGYIFEIYICTIMKYFHENECLAVGFIQMNDSKLLAKLGCARWGLIIFWINPDICMTVRLSILFTILFSIIQRGKENRE